MENMTSPSAGWLYLVNRFETVPYHSHLVVGILMIIILILAVTGNGLVICVSIISSNLRTPSNLLVVNLAVADILMAITGFPLLIINSFKAKWFFSDSVCAFYGATATIFGLMSMNSLAFISLDRYIAIISPFNIKKVSYQHILACISIIWFYSFTWGLMPVLGWNRYIVEGYGTTCSLDYFDRKSPSSYFLLTMFIADYIIPCLIVIFSYANIFWSVHKHNRSRSLMITSSRCMSDDQPRARENAKWSLIEYKIAKSILIVVLFYVLAWTPYAVVTMLAQYGDLRAVTPTLSMMPAVFAKFSTVYNPIIYSITHPRFSVEMKALVLRVFCRGESRAGFVNPTRNDSTKSESLSTNIRHLPVQCDSTQDVEELVNLNEMK